MRAGLLLNVPLSYLKGGSAHATPSRYAFLPLEVVITPEQGVMT